MACNRGGARRESGNAGREPGWSFSHPHPGHVCARGLEWAGPGRPGPAPPFLRRRGPTGGGSGPGFGCGPGVVAGAAAGGSAAPSLVVCVCASSPSCCKAFSCRRDSWGPRGGRHQKGGREGGEGGRQCRLFFFASGFFKFANYILQISGETLIFLPVLPRSSLRSALRRPVLSPPGADPSLLPARQPDLCPARGPQSRPRRAPGSSRRDEHRDATGGGPLPGMASTATTESTW